VLPGWLAFLAAVLLGGCLTVVSPRQGKPVAVGPGEALVFGRLRVTSPGYHREFLVFSRDVAEHVIPPDPLLNLELRGSRPPGGAVKYTTNLAPAVEGDGSFHWILARGDYALASNPRPYGSGQFDPADTTVLAQFTVPPGGGTVYVGTLEVVLRFEQRDVLGSWGGHTPYTILRTTVVDEGEQAFAALLSRYPSIPEPRATVPMAPEPQ
jgi:hypothetical protein